MYMAARNAERAQEKIGELAGLELPGEVRFVYNDASEDETYVSAVETVVADEGRIDVLREQLRHVQSVQGPGRRTYRPAGVHQYGEHQSEIRVHHVAGRVEAYGRARGGRIVNISSIGGAVPDISQIGYGTSKAAINYLTKLIAVHEARKNIRCNAVLPGMTATDAVQNALNDEFREFFLRHTPIRRMATPEEIANAVLYFASDESRFTTGQILEVCGGFGLATPVFGDLQDKSRAAV